MSSCASAAFVDALRPKIYANPATDCSRALRAANYDATVDSELHDGDRNDTTSRMLGGYGSNFFHCPSEITSTEPSTTLMAVCSSMA